MLLSKYDSLELLAAPRSQANCASGPGVLTRWKGEADADGGGVFGGARSPETRRLLGLGAIAWCLALRDYRSVASTQTWLAIE